MNGYIRGNRNNVILISVCIITILLHGTFFFMLNDSQMEFYHPISTPIAFIGQSFQQYDINQENDLEKHEHEEDLATIFKRLSKTDKEAHNDLASFDTIKENVSTNISNIIDERTIIPPDGKFSSEELAMVSDIPLNVPSSNSSYIPRQATMPLAFSTNRDLADELVLDTTEMLETLIDNVSENTHGIEEFYATSLEKVPLPNISLQNQSPTFNDNIRTLSDNFDIEDIALENTTMSTFFDDIPKYVDQQIPILIPEGSDNNIYSNIDQLATIANTDDFVVETHYSPSYDGSYYFFRLRFIPKADAVFKRIQQNMFFLVDRSNSIDKKRYDFSKKSIIKALSMLNDGDTFNILVFDDTVTRLAHNNLSWNTDNIAMAQGFLENQPHGGMFASTDLYSSLDKIIPEVVADNEVNTAILLSDGDTFLRLNQQRETIGEWTRNNTGKVTLFSVASGKRNNLPLLDLLCSFNKGMLVYTPDDSQLETTMTNLMHSIQTPIGKDIFATIVLQDKDTKINIFPRTSRLPNLYKEIPYTIYGTINKPKTFHIFLQGKYYDKWLDIKKTITFDIPPDEDNAIEKTYRIHYAYDFYEKYLNDGDISHLTTARKILAPLKVEPAFK